MPGTRDAGCVIGIGRLSSCSWRAVCRQGKVAEVQVVKGRVRMTHRLESCNAKKEDF